MGATPADIDRVWNDMRVDIGETRFVYLDANNKLDHSTTTPDSIRDFVIPQPSTDPPGLGGKIIKYTKQYNVFWNLVNAQHEFNIHDRMFTILCEPGVMPATDYVVVEQASGASGCLGRINFRERVDNGPGPGPDIHKTGSDDYGSDVTVVTGVSNATGAPTVCEPD
jgi:hypothetical protein